MYGIIPYNHNAYCVLQAGSNAPSHETTRDRVPVEAVDPVHVLYRTILPRRNVQRVPSDFAGLEFDVGFDGAGGLGTGFGFVFASFALRRSL